MNRLIDDLFVRRKRQTPPWNFTLHEIMQILGHPERSYPSIHVAGTNGKGSVTTKIAKVLEYSGYRVGLFTSPHLENFSERIQVNGEEISEEQINTLLPPLLKRFPGGCFFDYTTFMAFQYFAQQKVDIAVIEAGVGGLHDSTNVINPLVSIITSVGWDHADLLGSSLESIAFQKAGIIKSGVPVVIGPKARYSVIIERARSLKSRLVQVEDPGGDYDKENQAIAKAALQLVEAHCTLTPEAIEKGLRAKPPCRFERKGRFLCDVAHNPQGFEALLKAWDLRYAGRKFVALVGLSSDKDLATCLSMISSRAQHLYLVAAGSQRAASLKQLEDVVKQEKIFNYTLCPTIANGICLALAQEDDVIVCGSFYIMKEAREQIFGLQVGDDKVSLRRC